MRTDRYADQRSLIADTPAWVPEAAQTYLAHTEAGLTIRALARIAGCHASTVLRQVRRLESRRDDPLVDAALHNLGARFYREGPAARAGVLKIKEGLNMNEPGDKCEISGADNADNIARDALRVLRRMCEKGAVLAVAGDLDKAVVVRDGTTRTAVVDRAVAEAMALKDWIAADGQGRIIRYRITAAGRAALTQMLRDAGEEAMLADGFAEARADFAGQPRQGGDVDRGDDDAGTPRMRYTLSESPLTALARRRDKDGTRFLGKDLVRAGERLREDFELANMGPQVAQNWDRFLTAGTQGSARHDGGIGRGPDGARRRVSAALSDLGPGLSDVVLRCCCYLEGLETAEKRLGWSARSGKIVLRIALMRLKRHYDEVSGPGGGMIG
ncbi:helix-turn-helix domain-containing protein [Pseudosulfitobacter koreensis]|uniref:Helix-turn-helix domain-containing protein n=1 Tax=Pseudosulfitobacter koreensis TaxID=2968472 RepID=A0ABT1Z296_9RHOB|nr:helix-turn-helix domain-containing protein [Pseudosulfitobacter koreense]MCR8827254.1 helix-turn-helix domain-containing protein [Pseudosulfitobacter koreense]